MQTPEKVRDDIVKMVDTATVSDCEHQFGGWRAIGDNGGGEQVCQKCGMGARAYGMRREAGLS